MRHEFVNHIPEILESDVLYVSIDFDIAVHRCACGCGSEVVTPLSPAEWSITYDGRAVSLSPSIGNWNFPCKSHYWITGGRVNWAKKFGAAQMDAVRRRDHDDKLKLYEDRAPIINQPVTELPAAKPEAGIFKWLKGWFS